MQDTEGFFDDRVDFRSVDGVRCSPMEIIVPIGFYDPSIDLFHPFGTGLFISSRGLFCTAKHVFEFEPEFLAQFGHMSPNAYPAIYQYYPDHTANIRPIAAAHAHEQYDLAVGVCEPFKNLKDGSIFHNALHALSSEIVRIGTDVHQYSYPNPILHHDGKKLETVMIPLSTKGRVIDWLPNGMGGLFPSPVYVIEGYIGAGSSGGPVLDGSGRAFAVCSRGCDAGNYYYAIPLKEIADIVVSSVELGGTNPMKNPTIRDMSQRKLISFVKMMPSGE